MTVRVLDAQPGDPSARLAIREAVAALCAGELIAMPTETVYGLCASLTVPGAIERLREAKGRSETAPLTIQVPSQEAAQDWAAVPPWAQRILATLWPGPLTAVLPARRPETAVLGSQTTVGIRVPDHPVALALLAEADGPVVATSANRTGMPPLNDPRAIATEFADDASVVLTGGGAASGRASTVVRLVTYPPRILRLGEVTEERLLGLVGSTG